MRVFVEGVMEWEVSMDPFSICMKLAVDTFLKSARRRRSFASALSRFEFHITPLLPLETTAHRRALVFGKVYRHVE